jgi:hypothetical protein
MDGESSRVRRRLHVAIATQGSGASAAVTEFVAGLLAEAGENPYGAGSRTPKSTTPYSFREWCADVLKPAVS